MSDVVKKEVVEVVEEVATDVVDQAKEVTEAPQPVVANVEAQPKKGILSWTKEHAWQIAAAVGAGAAVIFFGKKVYQAGMPAEFELPTAIEETTEDVVDVIESVNSEE
jgi:hypothetical protein|nr:MAG TPA: hypothetical protein [Bacteriophage sp.]